MYAAEMVADRAGVDDRCWEVRVWPRPLLLLGLLSRALGHAEVHPTEYLRWLRLS
jgi:hypothetical protein